MTDHAHAWSMGVRSVCTGIADADAFVTRCCHADALPLTPQTRMTTGVCKNFILPFECSRCKVIIDIKTNEGVRLNVLDLRRRR
eukprot:scaffold316842_cov30-Tisochrysis_lutea.AAC.2